MHSCAFNMCGEGHTKHDQRKARVDEERDAGMRRNETKRKEKKGRDRETDSHQLARPPAGLSSLKAITHTRADVESGIRAGRIPR